MSNKTKITITGTGFVGLVTSAFFADRNFSVVTLDIDEEKIQLVNAGKSFIYEPNFSLLLDRVINKKKTLIASSKIIDSIRESDVTFICVGTPSNEDGSCNIKFIEQSAKDIGKAIAQKPTYHLVIAKSTIPPGTTRNAIKKIIEKESDKKAGKDFGLCMNPEFLREGQSVHDTIYPDRLIIGQLDEQSGVLLESLFMEMYSERKDDFQNNWMKIYNKKITCPPIMHVSLETAECIKYANNSFLATKISFINEFANICELIEGVDVNNIAKAIGLDYRINPHFLQAGAGFGGSCFPKDVNAIINFAISKGYTPNLLKSVLEVNEKQAKRMVAFTEQKLGSIKDKLICILGLSFKPETNDMRNAPSIKIIHLLLTKGAKIIAWDPQAISEARKREWIGEKITYATSLQEALKNADACLLITEWPEFKQLQPKDFKVMKRPILIDGRRIYDHKKFITDGIDYTGIGLG